MQEPLKHMSHRPVPSTFFNTPLDVICAISTLSAKPFAERAAGGLQSATKDDQVGSQGIPHKDLQRAREEGMPLPRCRAVGTTRDFDVNVEPRTWRCHHVGIL